MATNLQIMKLVNGNEILGDVVKETDTHVTVKEPVRVVAIPSKTSPQMPTVGFAPWAEFSEQKEFTIHKAHVIVSMKPVQEFINQYNTMFGGIVAPSSKLIVPGS